MSQSATQFSQLDFIAILPLLLERGPEKKAPFKLQHLLVKTELLFRISRRKPWRLRPTTHILQGNPERFRSFGSQHRK